MKAIAKCPHCGKQIETDCRGCIEGKTYIHNESKKPLIVEKVKWKIIDDYPSEIE
ncbi:MAG: hypothetical protein WCX73_02975 [Candidatus Pacearchaeota archaeon]|jgi:hypothetical protein